jgi:hypothetical protein
MVVRGSACEAASWTSRSGTPASSAAVMHACRSVCGPTGLLIAARRAVRRTIRPAPWRSSQRPSAVRKIGPSVTFADGQVDGPGGARRERNGHHLATPAHGYQRPVAALDAERFDVGAGGFGHP